VTLRPVTLALGQAEPEARDETRLRAERPLAQETVSSTGAAGRRQSRPSAPSPTSSASTCAAKQHSCASGARSLPRAGRICARAGRPRQNQIDGCRAETKRPPSTEVTIGGCSCSGTRTKAQEPEPPEHAVEPAQADGLHLQRHCHSRQGLITVVFFVFVEIPAYSVAFWMALPFIILSQMGCLDTGQSALCGVFVATTRSGVAIV
jgi:hypothetical protein